MKFFPFDSIYIIKNFAYNLHYHYLKLIFILHVEFSFIKHRILKWSILHNNKNRQLKKIKNENTQIYI